MIRDLTDPLARSVVERHRIYWMNGEWPRPLFRVTGPPRLADTPKPYYLEPEPLDVKAFKESTERSFDLNGLMDDDLIRMVGTGIVSEGLAGCRLLVRSGTCWAEPCFRSWDQFRGYDVTRNVWYRMLMDNTKRAVDALEVDRYPFSCMVSRGPVDMVGAVLGDERLCSAVFDRPQELKDLIARVTDLIIRTGLDHAALLPSYKGGYFNSYGTWSPGRTITFITDHSCLLSPPCYEEFFLPHDVRLCEAFDTPFVHLHAASWHHFEAWGSIPNLGLQCVIDQAWLPEENRNRPIGPQLEELLPVFRKLRGRGSLMLYGFWDEELIDLAVRELGAGGLALCTAAQDPDAIRGRYVTGEVWH